jgi:hypothetical protein
VDAQNFGWVAWRQVGRFGVADAAAVAEDESVAVGANPLWLSFMEDSPPFLSRTV